uniref:Uncharacterized protein n=1 Tax=Anguilla anguilla TaxID=7936 RepID=A0A0E9SFL5_ANGAN
MPYSSTRMENASE